MNLGKAMRSAQGIGKLKEVIVHCPGDELDILNPRNLKDYLFDGLVYKEEAQEEHNKFVAKLEESGVKVNRLTELLKTTDKEIHKALVANYWVIVTYFNLLFFWLSDSLISLLFLALCFLGLYRIYKVTK